MLRSDMQKSAKKATFTAKKSLTFYTFTVLTFSAWQGCTAFLANLKVCTNTKKVDNHWSRPGVACFFSLRHFGHVNNLVICLTVALKLTITAYIFRYSD